MVVVPFVMYILLPVQGFQIHHPYRCSGSSRRVTTGRVGLRMETSGAHTRITSPGHIVDGNHRSISEISDVAVRHEAPTTGMTSMSLPPRGLLDRKVILAIRDQAGSDDPILSDFFSDFLELGPMQAMQHLGRPSVTSRLAVLMAEATTDPCRGRAPVPGWC